MENKSKSKMNNNEQLYEIKNEVDSKIKTHYVYTFSRDRVLYELIIQYSFIYFYYMFNKDISIKNPYCNINISERNLEGYFQESMKWATRWAFEYCNNENKVNNERPKFEHVVDLLNIAYVYDSFFNYWYGFAKKSFNVELKGNIIKFTNSNCNEKFFHVYNSWRLSVREKLNFNYASKGKNFLSKQKFISQSDFTIKENWDLGKYKWNDLKQFVLKLNEELDKSHYIKIQEANKLGRATISREVLKDFIIIKSIEEWISYMVAKTRLDYEVVKNILNDLTYDSSLSNPDLALQFFLPLSNDRLMISTLFVNYNIRPQRNLLSLIPKINKSCFDKVSNGCEDIQKRIIKNKIVNKNIIFAEGISREQKLRPAMDMLFLDKKTRQLLVCELKWNIPASSTKEVLELDSKVNKAIDRINQYSRKYVEEHMNTILEEYFGEEWRGVSVRDYECIAAISESIGSGAQCPFNAPVITVDHLIDLLNVSLSHTFTIIRNGMRECYSNEIEEGVVELYLYNYQIYGSCYKIKG